MTYKDLRDKVADIPAYVIDDDFLMYFRYLPFIRDNESIIDVGTGWGKSCIAMALMNPNALIWTIDDGSYPIYQGWAKDQEEYKQKIEQVCHDHGTFNVSVLLTDFKEKAFNTNRTYPLIHIDMTKEREVEALMLWLPKVSLHGIVLIRNFERMKDNIDGLLDDFEYLDQSGLIHVYRRIV